MEDRLEPGLPFMKFWKLALSACCDVYFRKRKSAEVPEDQQQRFWDHKNCNNQSCHKVLISVIIHSPVETTSPSVLVKAWLKVKINLGELQILDVRGQTKKYSTGSMRTQDWLKNLNIKWKLVYDQKEVKLTYTCWQSCTSTTHLISFL